VLNTFTVERTLNPNQFTSTFTPSFPQGLIAAATPPNAAVEIRESFSFNAQNQVLTLNLFPVQAGAVTPTPFSSLTQGTGTTFAPNAIFGTLAMKVDKVYVSCTPAASVMFVGTVATNAPVSPFGDLTGAPIAVGIGLSTSTTGTTPGGTTPNPSITNVAVLVSGRVVEYSAAGAGTVNFTNSSVTPPGTTGNVAIVILPVAPSTLRVVDLVASSSAPNVNFQWTVVFGAADIGNPKSSHAIGYIEGGAGTYTFRVTVTDASGNVLGTQDVTVQFL
jgi:hypothetical protein